MNENRKNEFMNELNELFKKYNITMSAEDQWTGYRECGEDLHILIDSRGVCFEDDFDIDLGRYYPLPPLDFSGR